MRVSIVSTRRTRRIRRCCGGVYCSRNSAQRRRLPDFRIISCWVGVIVMMLTAFSVVVTTTYTTVRAFAPTRRSLFAFSQSELQRRYRQKQTTTSNFALFGTKSKSSSTIDSTKKKSPQKQQHHLVIVESPAKCATIEKILNSDANNNNIQYSVTSCMGHIRNLPKKNTHKRKSSSPFPYSIAGIDLDSGTYAPEYVIIDGKQRIVRKLQEKAKSCDGIVLATDPDREGEAMAWHLAQVLVHEDATSLKKKPLYRIRFSEITKTAILNALTFANNTENNNNNTAMINDNLVAAQETRRVLDRLAGYTVSPVLWKKIAPGLSAGRVQSVGLQLIVQREIQRLQFEITPYYDLTALLLSNADEATDDESRGVNITARLVSINGTAVANSGKDFTSQGKCLTERSKRKIHLTCEEQAAGYVETMLQDGTIWKIHSITSKQRTSKPPRPYKTSTLQQDAVRQLGLPVSVTMRTAQQLYEAGYITYMRTDSTVLSSEAEEMLEETVCSQFGQHMLSSSDNTVVSSRKKNADKFAQEAHEAIRPAIQGNGQFLKPEELKLSNPAAVSLYRMIYQRTLAYRMTDLITNQKQVIIEGINEDTVLHFRTSGSVVVAPGYTLVYDSQIDDDNEQQLPPLSEGQILQLKELFPVGHETQPPPRYTEASFVKELEALGVGRPSTYAGIVQILRDRAYVGSLALGNDSNNKRRGGKTPSGSAISAVRAAGGEEFTGGGSARGPLVPSLSAFVVCALLEKYCPTYVDPSFTAQMEDRLDRIASGADENSGIDERIAYLDEFYAGENGLAAQIKRIEDTVDATEARRAMLPALMQNNSTGGKEAVQVGLFIGPWGPYVQRLSDVDAESDKKPATAPLPPGMAADITTIKPSALKALLATKEGGGVILGQHPDDGRNIRLKTGRFGAYLQWGDDDEEGTTTHSLPRQKSVMRQLDDFYDEDGGAPLNTVLGLTLEEAVGYVGLPRTVSTFNELPIVAAIGPYGPYLKYNNTFMSLNPSDGDVLTIDEETAEKLVIDGIINRTSKLGRGVIAELGEKDGSQVIVKKGRFGAYIKWKRVNAKLPVEYSEKPEAVPLEEAWSLIQAKAKDSTKGSPKGGKKNADPNLPPPPKRPLSAYLHFCAAKRPAVAESVKSLGEVSKKLATLWAETSVDDRKEYEELAASGKVEYEEKKKAWQEECQQSEVKRKAGKSSGRKGSDPAVGTQPKRPKSAYLFFCSSKRPEVSQKVKSLGEISKELARLWAETTDRSEFEKLAAADKQRYEHEMKGFTGVNGDREPSIGKTKAEVAKKSISGANSVYTPRAPSAYMLFCREFRPTIVDASGEKLPFGETAKRLAAKWKACDKATKDKFQQLAAVEKEKTLSAQE